MNTKKNNARDLPHYTNNNKTRKTASVCNTALYELSLYPTPVEPEVVGLELDEEELGTLPVAAPPRYQLPMSVS